LITRSKKFRASNALGNSIKLLSKLLVRISRKILPDK
jgi:hypothetical protein